MYYRKFCSLKLKQPNSKSIKFITKVYTKILALNVCINPNTVTQKFAFRIVLIICSNNYSIALSKGQPGPKFSKKYSQFHTKLLEKFCVSIFKYIWTKEEGNVWYFIMTQNISLVISIVWFPSWNKHTEPSTCVSYSLFLLVVTRAEECVEVTNGLFSTGRTASYLF